MVEGVAAPGQQYRAYEEVACRVFPSYSRLLRL